MTWFSKVLSDMSKETGGLSGGVIMHPKIYNYYKRKYLKNK